MKRFACHRLYVFSDGCYSTYVAELDENGKVSAYYPLKEELCGTEWIGGVIVVSPHADLQIEGGESFRAFLKRAVGDTSQSVYAWHIDHFDFTRNELTAESRLTRLQ